MKTCLILLIRIYQYTLAPFLGSHCRFYPSCSEYSLSVLKKYGAYKGTYLTLKRLLKCHPWHPGGNDPIP